MKLFKGFLRYFHDYNSDLKQQHNKAALARLDDSDANKKHIEQRSFAKSEATRLVGIAVRRIKENRQKCEAAIEMYLDDWAFHNGPITRENLAEAMSDCVDRIRQRAQAAQRVAEDRAEDHDGMKDFPF
jgi:hypothetical protein